MSTRFFFGLHTTSTLGSGLFNGGTTVLHGAVFTENSAILKECDSAEEVCHARYAGTNVINNGNLTLLLPLNPGYYAPGSLPFTCEEDVCQTDKRNQRTRRFKAVRCGGGAAACGGCARRRRRRRSRRSAARRARARPPCARVSRAPEATGTRGTLNSVFERKLDVGIGKWEGMERGVSIPYALATWSERDRSRESEVS